MSKTITEELANEIAVKFGFGLPSSGMNFSSAAISSERLQEKSNTEIATVVTSIVKGFTDLLPMLPDSIAAKSKTPI